MDSYGEGRIADKSEAQEMAEAEKPWRDMAAEANKEHDAAVEEIKNENAEVLTDEAKDSDGSLSDLAGIEEDALDLAKKGVSLVNNREAIERAEKSASEKETFENLAEAAGTTAEIEYESLSEHWSERLKKWLGEIVEDNKFIWEKAKEAVANEDMESLKKCMGYLDVNKAMYDNLRRERDRDLGVPAIEEAMTAPVAEEGKEPESNLVYGPNGAIYDLKKEGDREAFNADMVENGRR